MTTDATRHAGMVLFTLAALGEMAVGFLIAAFPSLMTLLIGAPLAGGGLLVARMMGVAVLVVGLTWWLSRREAESVVRHAPGFILYNIGVGALFVVAATSMAQSVIPWIVAIAHLVVGTSFAAIVATASLPGAGRRH